ncbi:MAG: hypothetical protein ACRD1T_13265, partial [Acidimicrobiia bacterium]
VNHGESPCSIVGPAALELRDRSDRIVSVSKGKKPFIPSGDGSLGPFGLIPSLYSDTSQSSDPGIMAWAYVSQGDCPGGTFPARGRLLLLLSGIGSLQIGGFDDDLPFNYRCDLQFGSPSSETPELLIGDVGGTPSG